MWPRLEDRRPFVVLATALVALAWLSLWWWGHAPHGRYAGHEELGHAAGQFGPATLALLFVTGWTLMTVAMMLPTSLPLVALFSAFVRARAERVRLTALLVVGYVGVWTAFGLVVHLGDRSLHVLVERSVWLGTNAWAIGAGTVLLAGAYQFAPLKYRCLEKCRSPLGFVLQHWHGRRGEADAFRLGAHHGLYCLGCCWSLMLMLFVVGIGSLGWMLALAAVMAVEKNVSWGRRLSAPLGMLLLAWGAVLVATKASLVGAA